MLALITKQKHGISIPNGVYNYPSFSSYNKYTHVHSLQRPRICYQDLQKFHLKKMTGVSQFWERKAVSWKSLANLT